MERTSPLKDAARAIALLTAVPVRADAPEPGQGANAAGWFPAVGLALGLLGYAGLHVAERFDVVSEAPLMVAAGVVVVWALLTRMLHWDGLADVADGYWGSHDPQRRLEIMSDSHTGAFGVTAVAMTMLVEVSAILAIISLPHELPLAVVPMIARLSATFASWLGTPAREGGLGRSMMGRPTLAGIVPAVATLAVSLAVFVYAYRDWKGLLFAALGVLIAAGVPHVLSKRFGGVTGDVMGASVLLTETLLFVVFAIGQ